MSTFAAVLTVLLVTCFWHKSDGAEFTIEEMMGRILGAVKTYEKECIAETGADPNHVLEFVTKGIPSDTRSFKCFLKCISVRQGTMDERGRINVEGYKKVLQLKESPQVEHVRQVCVEPKHEDPCESAFVGANCVLGTLLGGA